MAPLHPFHSLTPEEIVQTSTLVRNGNPGERLIFKCITPVEPNKTSMVEFLEAEHAGRSSKQPPARQIYARFYIRRTGAFYEAVVDLTAGKVLGQQVLPGMHAPGSQDEVEEVEQLVMNDADVKKVIEQLQLPARTEVICEAWPYGSDGVDDGRRMFQCWMFLKSVDPKNSHPAVNYYAHPLHISPVFDFFAKRIIRIDRLPLHINPKDEPATLPPWEPNPDQEYATSLQPSIRKSLKPIHITQPEGVSFTITDDEVVSWEKWRFHLTFNEREGAVLRDVTYDGRPTFYRLSLAEMTVPYADPRPPYHRKSAYDLGEGGAGATANDLQLGCDCLGVIHYFDGWMAGHNGLPIKLPNAICMHEVDNGISWKHTNTRNGHAEVARSRELVIQLIMTIANYEYALYWILDTEGAIHYEVRATGIMSVVPTSQKADLSNLDFGVMVAPGVMAPMHQHIFSLRIEPAIDSYRDNGILVQRTLTIPRNPQRDPFGVQYKLDNEYITKESFFDLDATKNTVVKVVNRQKKNPVTGHNVGFSIHCPATQMQLAHQNSMHYRRAEFADHHFYFTKSDENELYPGSKYPWQSRGGDGLRTWASRCATLDGSSVVWCNFGFSHNPRPEDWPVMPCEIFRMHIKPSHFFMQNPALDLPASTQAVNRSQLANTKVNGTCCGVNSHL